MDFSTSKRIVVKVGSALLVDPKTSQVRSAWLKALCADIATLKAEKKDVLVVTSGAIALARGKFGYQGTLSPEEKRAAATQGQPLLMQAWSEAASFGVGQLLLTHAELLTTKETRANTFGTIKTLLKRGVVPVINENDAIAMEEIVFGDNDQLAAEVAVLAEAHKLILLSDIDGLYTADPRKDPNAKHIPVVPVITEEIRAMAGPAKTQTSNGGMVTKIKAAGIAKKAGCATIIVKGDMDKPLSYIRSGQARYTEFTAKPFCP